MNTNMTGLSWFFKKILSPCPLDERKVASALEGHLIGTARSFFCGTIYDQPKEPMHR